MKIIPAIDIKDGQCVRLFQGEMEKETVYYNSPMEAAKQWVDQGAEFLHIVDLDGALEGRPVNKLEVTAICKGFNVPVELGGGLRTLDAVEEALEIGAERVILGTMAYKNQIFLRLVCRRFPGKVLVGIDAREGKASVQGWKENTSMDAVELARRCEGDGASQIIYTDIIRDGTSGGLNIEQTKEVAKALNIPVIASGGVASLEDIRRIRNLEEDGVEGVIVGRALYAGAFSLKEAIAVAGRTNAG